MLGDLGDGLLLRRAVPTDAEAIAAFNARVHHSPGGPFERQEAHTGVAAMTRDLMSGEHPACRPEDFTVVEDTATGSVVSSACRIEQRFFYGGAELHAGLPELVGTHPDCRRLALVRKQMAVLHAWSRRRGHLMQAIVGTPYFYRRCGYEMAVWSSRASRSWSAPWAEAVGYVCHAGDASSGTLGVYAYELADGVSRLQANPFVLNELAQATGKRPDSLPFSLGEGHPFTENA